MNARFIHTNDRSRCFFSTFCTLNCTFPRLQRLSIKKRICTRPRIQSTHQSFQFNSTFWKIHQTHFLADHSCIRCRALFRLFCINSSSICNWRKRSDQKSGTFLCQFVKKASTCLILSKWYDCLRDHISRIQSNPHLHDRYTGFFFSVDHGLLDRCRTSVFRQKRCMNIQTSILWHIQDRLWNDLSKSGYDDHIRFQFF